MVRYSSATVAPIAFLVVDLRCLSCCLSLFACSGGGGEGEGGISAGEVADSGELPVGDDERGVLFLRQQFPRVLGGLALAVGPAFPPDGTEGGRVTAGF
jgi:hypothetical protein